MKVVGITDAYPVLGFFQYGCWCRAADRVQAALRGMGLNCDLDELPILQRISRALEQAGTGYASVVSDSSSITLKEWASIYYATGREK